MKKIIIIATLAAIGLITTPVMAFSPVVKPALIAVDMSNKAVIFAGVAMSQKWAKFTKFPLPKGDPHFDPPLWHLVIGGLQVNPAISRVPMFVAWVNDVDVAKALESLGAKGDKFEIKHWTERMDPNSPYPKMTVKGTKVKAYFTWTDKRGTERTVEANEFLENTSGKLLNLMYIGKQHPSQCIICLYSCIGGITSNHNLSTKDYMDGKAVWSIKPGILPPDGTPVLITLKIVE